MRVEIAVPAESRRRILPITHTVTRAPIRDAALLGLGLLHVLLTIRFLDPQLQDTDWRCFYESAAAWLRGGEVYSAAYRANYLPPPVALLIAPLVPFGLQGSFAIWTLINLALVFGTCRRILRARPEIPPTFLVLAVCSLLPASYVWIHGQWTWIMFACVTRAWLAKTPRQSALWLTPVMMIKPPFLLLALALPWRIGVPAAIIAVLASLATVPILGVSLWADWWSMRLVDIPLGFFNNASLVGLVARIDYGVLTVSPKARLDTVLLASAGVLAVSLLPGVWQSRGDARWARAWLWAILVMPIGWLNYLPTAAGPILSTANPRTLAIVFAVWLLPRHAMWALAMTGGWVAFASACLGIVSVLLLWWSCQADSVVTAARSPSP